MDDCGVYLDVEFRWCHHHYPKANPLPTNDDDYDYYELDDVQTMCKHCEVEVATQWTGLCLPCDIEDFEQAYQEEEGIHW